MNLRFLNAFYGNRATSGPVISRWLVYGAIAVTTSFAVGCGSGLAPVQGTLSLDGQNVRAEQGLHATIVFQPEGGSGALGMALVDASGQYKIRTGNVSGVEPGVYQVSVNIIEKTPSTDPQSPPNRRRISPAHYAKATTSGLRYEIPPGGKQVDIELSSDQ